LAKENNGEGGERDGDPFSERIAGTEARLRAYP
jgi:hypothetical protein